jgi:flagellar basal-body rod protein FlgB
MHLAVSEGGGLAMRMLDSIFDRTVSGLTKAMDLAWKRNEAIAANIANAETPQYRAVDLNFGSELERAFNSTEPQDLLRTDSKHLDITNKSEAKLVADYSGTTKADGNNVDIDMQMVSLADNSGDFAKAAQLIRRQIGLVRTAIREGR